MDGTRYLIVVDDPDTRFYVGAKTWFTRRFVKRVNSAKVFASADKARQYAESLIDSDKLAKGGKCGIWHYDIMTNQEAAKYEWDARLTARKEGA